MSTEPSSPRPPSSIRELESLRIARKAEKRPTRLVPAVIILVVLGAASAAAYEIYGRTIGRPPEVQTALVTIKQAGQPGTVLTGSGYVVTQHKYIKVGTMMIGQIVAEPIEEGQHVKKGDLLARIDTGGTEAQLNQAIADRNLAAANIALYEAQVKRQTELFKNHIVSQVHGFRTALILPDGSPRDAYLHTSPEFAMKKLLTAGEERIYALTGVFRNRERTAVHAPEFTMIEWYRTGASLERLVEDCVALTALAAHIVGAKTSYFAIGRPVRSSRRSV